ncbi:hypothetical protein KM043_005559 [Ampulex compressa]|nr:hypothetical protein KM043_005559 [Ampulex compressa]
MDLKTFCQRLPKVELHAHLNGSLSLKTLKKLHKLQNPQGAHNEDIVMNIDDLSSLGECFKVFEIAHSLTNTPEAVYTATCDVIEEFHEDNVIYLELRSTPRAVKGSMTKEGYLEAIMRAFRACKEQHPSMFVKLLISVNRKEGFKAAQENVRLAIDFRKKYPDYVIGLDLSGDPTTGDAFISLLQTSRKAGLKIAAHCAEVPNEKEAMDILSFKPDRLGHCTCIHPDLQGSKNLFDALLESKIPIELCLTSNIKCKTVPSYTAHQFKHFYDAGHPICLATDDKGVFGSSLSHEFEIASATFGLGEERLKALCLSSVEYAFANADEKKMLLAAIESFD